VVVELCPALMFSLFSMISALYVVNIGSLSHCLLTLCSRHRVLLGHVI
jgi:hypothetical protein